MQQKFSFDLSPLGYNSLIVRRITQTNSAEMVELKAPPKEHPSLAQNLSSVYKIIVDSFTLTPHSQVKERDKKLFYLIIWLKENFTPKIWGCLDFTP